MIVEFAGQSARDGAAPQVHTGRLVNCYREPVLDGGRTRNLLQPVPGSQDFATLPGVFLRAMETIAGNLYAVCSTGFYRIDATGSVSLLGTVEDGPDVSISGHDGFVTVVSGGHYYVWNGATFTEPTIGAFASFGSVEQLGHYTILTQSGGSFLQWSEISDATVLPPLNFNDADERDDDLVRAFVVEGFLWAFGTGSTELWTRTGDGGAGAFARLSGSTKDVGLKAFGLVTRFDGGAFFVGDDGLAYVAAGTQLRPVATPGVLTAIRDYVPLRCFSYEARGHKFCAITFRDCPAWVFDLGTGEWHERAEGVDFAPWSATCAAKFGNGWYVGSNGGAIHAMTGHTDGSAALHREGVSASLYNDAKRFTIKELEFFAPKGGNGNLSFWLSDNDGQTWGKERVVSTGATGHYAQRMNSRALGQFRQLTVRFRVSDAAFLPMYSDARVRL